MNTSYHPQELPKFDIYISNFSIDFKWLRSPVYVNAADARLVNESQCKWIDPIRTA